MKSEAIETAADLLARLRLDGRRLAAQIDDLPEACRPQNASDAYAIQERLRDRLIKAGAGQLVGWKIGCTTRVMRDYLKIDHPCAGGLYAGSVAFESTRIPRDRYFRIGFECEIAIRLGADLPEKKSPYDRTTVGHGVAEGMASIEIIDERFRHFHETSPFSLMADDFFSAGCVLGTPVEGISRIDLSGLVGGFEIDGNKRDTFGRGAAIMDHPFNALAWLANHQIERGQPLLAGQYVTLGSVVKTIYPTEPCTVRAVFDGFGEACVVLE